MQPGVSLKGVSLDGQKAKAQSSLKKVTDTAGGLKDLIGSVKSETVLKSKFNQGLNQSARSKAKGEKNNVLDPRISYAYSDMGEVEKNVSNAQGAPSLFNEYAIMVYNKADVKNKFFDVDGETNLFPKKNRELTLDSLLDSDKFKPSKDEENQNPTPYFVSDFLYGRYLKKVPLNHMITLRRFPFPTYDNLKFEGNKTFKPIAQAVTYFGDPTGNDLAELTKFTGVINWETLKADVNDVEGDEKGFENTPFIDKLQNKSPKAYNIAKHATGLNSSRSQVGQFGKDDQDRAKLATDFNYTNKVLGPVNVIMETNVRQRGISANQDITLNFEYELRSFSSINPKIALIDLLCNMLALSYNNAKFWGGANRYFPNLESQQFGFLGDQQKFYSGDYGGYLKSFVGQMGDMLGNGFNALGSLLGGIMSGNLGALTGALSGGANYVMDLERAKSRPKVLGFKALLTGLPIGEWHMVIGNPHNPISTVGNLIVKGFEFNFEGPLGADDFPSILKFSITLGHGRPRDKGDIESLFNMGGGRIYHAPKGQADVANMSSSTGTILTDGNKNGKPKEEKSYIGQDVVVKPQVAINRGSQQLNIAKQVVDGSVF